MRLRPPGCDKIALVLQGGGALGAYQAGVYEALHEAGIEPDWVSGVSIGPSIRRSSPAIRASAGWTVADVLGAVTDRKNSISRLMATCFARRAT